MIWLTWRQHRKQALFTLIGLAALAALMVPTGLSIRRGFSHLGLADCLRAAGTTEFVAPGPLSDACHSAFVQFNGQFRTLSTIGILFLFLPLLVGLFWGAPLVARELEHGTHRLVWTQGVSRRHWALVKIALVGTATLIAAAVYGLGMSWWFEPLNRAGGEGFNLLAFDMRGVAPIGYTLFAVALGVAAGTVWPKVLPAMAATLAGFLGVRILLTALARSRYLPARTFSYPVQGATLVPNQFSGDWIQSRAIHDASGNLVMADAEALCPKDAPDCGGFATGSYNLITYHPASQFWLFQGIETVSTSSSRRRWCTSRYGGSGASPKPWPGRWYPAGRWRVWWVAPAGAIHPTAPKESRMRRTVSFRAIVAAMAVPLLAAGIASVGFAQPAAAVTIRQPLTGLVKLSYTTASNSNPIKLGTVLCPIGTTPIGLGWSTTPATSELRLQFLKPIGRTVYAQVVEDYTGYSSNWSFTVYATCANTPAGWGLSSHQITSTVPNDLYQSTRADCPVGTVPLGAGVEQSSSHGDIVVADINPDLTGVTVAAHAYEGGINTTWSITAYAICANPPLGWELQSSDSSTTYPFAVKFAVCSPGNIAVSAGVDITNAFGQAVITSLRTSTYMGDEFSNVSVHEDETGAPDTWTVSGDVICIAP